MKTMKTQRAVLPLAFLSAALILGCQEQGSGPVEPEGLGPQFHAAHPACEGHKKNDPGCNGGGGGDKSAATVELAGGLVTIGPQPVELRGGGTTKKGCDSRETRPLSPACWPWPTPMPRASPLTARGRVPSTKDGPRKTCWTCLWTRISPAAYRWAFRSSTKRGRR